MNSCFWLILILLCPNSCQWNNGRRWLNDNDCFRNMWGCGIDSGRRGNDCGHRWDNDRRDNDCSCRRDNDRRDNDCRCRKDNDHRDNDCGCRRDNDRRDNDCGCKNSYNGERQGQYMPRTVDCGCDDK